ncbi:MAG TPA: MerR family transcriptional regulator, partial [Acidimicrobiales bacterium]|nr:MerR family transcriptional regulator [Acidimicrobiales bacterium]
MEHGEGGTWRIDDLARLSGTTVDTIRFYQREGLLPPAERQGRSMLYGPAHLERLERIRDLQARHFTLKAIRALAEEGRLHILDRLFAPDHRSFTLPELLAEADVDEALGAELQRAGLLAPPEEHGSLAYDGDDLALLSALRASLDRGMPRPVLLVLVRLYQDHMDALREELFAAFRVGGSGLGPSLSDEDLDAFRTVAANDIDAFLED